MTSALFVVALALAAPEGQPLESFALVIGNNASFDGSRAALRFADDDAAKTFEVLGLTTTHAELLTVFDRDTQRLFPELVATARAPRYDEVRAALTRLFTAIREASARGARTALYVVYSGHGDVTQERQGYVHLLDRGWRREDLYRDVLDASPASVNHLIVDACNAYFMVAGRGQAKPAGDFAGLVRGFVDRQSLAAHPNTGVLLSTSSATEVHEWGRVESGVFSHELRSALSGAADANADGAVDYDEVAAFMAAANGAVPDRKARIDAFIAAPAQRHDEPLLALTGRGARLALPASFTGRIHLEDDRGVRAIDLNKGLGTATALRLVPRPRYYVRSPDQELVLEPAEDGRLVELASLTAAPVMLASRGSVADALERYLFAIPFDAQFVAGFREAAAQAPALQLDAEVIPPAPTSALRPWVYVSAGASLVATATAVVLEAWSRSTAASYRRAAGDADDVASLKRSAESRHDMALTFGAVGLTAAGTALGLWLAE